MTGRYISFGGQPYDASRPATLRAAAVVYASLSDPPTTSTLGWLLSLNPDWGPDDPIPADQNLQIPGWLSTAGLQPSVQSIFLNTTQILPDRVIADTLRDAVNYLNIIYPDLTQNTVGEVVAQSRLNPTVIFNYGATVTADQHLGGPYFFLSAWVYIAAAPPAASSSSGAQPKRYLRMNQRDDGAGITRHPRIYGTGSNNPTSAQSGRPRRLGNTNYL